MADAQRTVDIIFNGVDKTAAAVQSAIKNTGGFAQGIQTATQPVADFTASALKFEAALLTAGAAVTAFSIKTAGDFDAAFREISSLIDEPIASLGEFRDQILDYASGSTQSFDQTTAAIYAAISAGIDYRDSVALVAQAEQLAVAGRADLGETTTVLVSALNAYGLGAEEATRFSDALFTTVKLGQTTLPELSANLAKVTTTAATLGVPFEEVLAAVAALTAAGAPTSEAITQISGVLAALLKPSDTAAKTAKALGLEFDAQSVKANGLQGTLSAVAEATGGNEELMAKLFPRVEALRAVFPLTGIAAKDFAANLEEMNNSAGATLTAYEKLADEMDNITQRLSNALKGTFAELGTPLLDEFADLGDAISDIFKAIADSVGSGSFGDLNRYVEEVLGGMAETAATVAQNLPAALAQADFSGFVNGLQEIEKAFDVVFGSIDLTTVAGLARGIELIGAGFEGLSRFTAGVITSFEPLVNALRDLADGSSDVGEGFNQLGESFGFVLQINKLSGAITAVIPILQGFAALFAVNQAGNLLGGLKAFGESLSGNTGIIANLGKLGALGAAGSAGFGLGTLANEVTRLTTGESLSSMLADWALDLSGVNDQAKQLTKTLEVSGTAAENAIADADERMGSLGQSVSQAVDFWGEYGSESGQVVAELYNLEGVWQEIQDATADTTTATKELAQAAEEISLDEKLALIEANAAVATASIQANAQTLSSAFESIGVSVESTGNSLTELFGLLGDENISKFDKLGLKDQIELENERRQESLDLQKKLTEERIRELRLRNDALRNGGGLIQIDGAGLQPHLEAFMFEILEALHVRVNAEGYNLLVGAD